MKYDSIRLGAVKPGHFRLFYTDGRIVDKEGKPTLETLRKLLGIEWCEVVSMHPPTQQVFVLDEEGRLNGSQPNPIATALLAATRPGVGELFGNVAQVNDEDFRDEDE